MNQKKHLMLKRVVPLILLTILSGCNFSNKPNKNNKESGSKVKSANQNVISIKNIEHFNDTVLKSNKPTVVKFETKWCGACKTMAPIYKKLANKYKNKIDFVKADIQKISKLADKYKLQGVPTFIFFKNGKIVDQIIGSKAEHPFENKLKKLL